MGTTMVCAHFWVFIIKNQDLRSEMIKGEHGGPKSKLNVEVHKYITKKSPGMSGYNVKL